MVGRPASPTERAGTAFHEPAESAAKERKPFTEHEALADGGSFDAVAPPGTPPPG